MEAEARLQQLQSKLELEDQNKQLMRRFFEAWGKGDHETLSQLTGPNYVFYFPSNTQNPLSREDLLSTNKTLREAFPDIRWQMKDLVADGDMVVFRFIQRGTHEAMFQGVPATGTQAECSGIIMNRIRDGRVVEQREEYDSLGLMAQLGMTLTPKK
jgi:steroid delta-isomerase-like uncharacterized protein